MRALPYDLTKQESLSAIAALLAEEQPDVRILVNAGGRVLVVTADGDTVTDAIAKAYAGVAKIRWTGVQYRRDIARRAVNRK